VDSFDLLLNGENQAIRRFIIEANELQWFEQEFSSSDGKSWKQIVEIKLAGSKGKYLFWVLFW